MVLRRALAEAFRSRRLLAQRLDERHLDQVAWLAADPRVMRWLGGRALEGGVEDVAARAGPCALV